MIKTTVIVLVLIVGGIAGVRGLDYWKARDANDLCSRLAESETLDGVRHKANSAGYSIHQRRVGDGELELAIPTQGGYACVVTVKFGLLIRKEVVAAESALGPR